jgi:hypothetical protein
MAYLDIYRVKDHLRVDFDDDDPYIYDLIDMIEGIVSVEIGEDLADLENAGGLLPPRLMQAMLLLVGHYYLIREPVVMGVAASKVPLGFEYLIAPYKNYTVK